MTLPQPPSVIWNGSLVPAAEARVSVFDTGFLYGDGVYETMRAYEGRIFELERHLARLLRSAARVSLPPPPTRDLPKQLEILLEANQLPHAVCRITYTRGRLERRLDLKSAGSPSLLVTADVLPSGADERRHSQGIRVGFSKFTRNSTNPLSGVKSTSYQVSLLARNEAREMDCDEVLLANETAEICEGAASNVFFVEGTKLVTPPAASGILEGVSREVTLENARRRGITVVESTRTREQLGAVDEIFFTGTTLQVAGVTWLHDRPFGNGAVGPVTRLLLQDYLERVQRLVRGPRSSAGGA